MLFPFLFTDDTDDWGLPRRLFQPAGLLAHVWARVAPGGILVMANQGARECQEQRRLLAELSIPAETAPFDSPFRSYAEPRFIHVAKRASSPSFTSMPSPGRSDSLR